MLMARTKTASEQYDARKDITSSKRFLSLLQSHLLYVGTIIADTDSILKVISSLANSPEKASQKLVLQNLVREKAADLGSFLVSEVTVAANQDHDIGIFDTVSGSGTQHSEVTHASVQKILLERVIDIRHRISEMVVVQQGLQTAGARRQLSGNSSPELLSALQAFFSLEIIEETVFYFHDSTSSTSQEKKFAEDCGDFLTKINHGGDYSRAVDGLFVPKLQNLRQKIVTWVLGEFRLDMDQFMHAFVVSEEHHPNNVVHASLSILADVLEIIHATLSVVGMLSHFGAVLEYTCLLWTKELDAVSSLGVYFDQGSNQVVEEAQQVSYVTLFMI